MNMEQGNGQGQGQGLGSLVPYGYVPSVGFDVPAPVATQAAVAAPNYLLYALIALAAWWAYTNWGSLSKKLEAFKTLTGGHD